jgi:hypothetical protein
MAGRVPNCAAMLPELPVIVFSVQPKTMTPLPPPHPPPDPPHQAPGGFLTVDELLYYVQEDIRVKCFSYVNVNRRERVTFIMKGKVTHKVIICFPKILCFPQRHCTLFSQRHADDCDSRLPAQMRDPLLLTEMLCFPQIHILCITQILCFPNRSSASLKSLCFPQNYFCFSQIYSTLRRNIWLPKETLCFSLRHSVSHTDPLLSTDMRDPLLFTAILCFPQRYTASHGDPPIPTDILCSISKRNPLLPT